MCFEDFNAFAKLSSFLQLIYRQPIISIRSLFQHHPQSHISPQNPPAESPEYGKPHKLVHRLTCAYFPQNWPFWLVFLRIPRFMRRFIRLWKSHLGRTINTPENPPQFMRFAILTTWVVVVDWSYFVTFVFALPGIFIFQRKKIYTKIEENL